MSWYIHSIGKVADVRAQVLASTRIPHAVQGAIMETLAGINPHELHGHDSVRVEASGHVHDGSQSSPSCITQMQVVSFTAAPAAPAEPPNPGEVYAREVYVDLSGESTGRAYWIRDAYTQAILSSGYRNVEDAVDYIHRKGNWKLVDKPA